VIARTVFPGISLAVLIRPQPVLRVKKRRRRGVEK
jgi:hypothetical protein